jgi:hypothetical protein
MDLSGKTVAAQKVFGEVEIRHNLTRWALS